MRSLNSGLYVLLTDNFRIALDMILILSLITVFCGPKYFLLTFGSFGLYSWWTLWASKRLLSLFKQQTTLQNRRENYHQEQLMLFDSIKQFS